MDVARVAATTTPDVLRLRSGWGFSGGGGGWSGRWFDGRSSLFWFSRCLHVAMRWGESLGWSERESLDARPVVDPMMCV